MPSLKKNLFYNFILSASQLLLPLVSIPYVSRILRPEGIGKVSFIDSFTYYFISVAEFGVVVYGMREVARVRDNAEKKQKLVSELLALHVITSLCSLLLYIVAIFLVWDKIQDIRLLFFSLSFLLVNFFSCEWYFLGMEEFRYITLRSLTTRMAGLVSIFLLIKSPADYYIYYAIIVISAIANSIWNNILLFKKVGISFAGINWQRHIRYMWIIYLLDIFYSIPLMLDNLFLRLMSTDAAVGFYALSIKMAKLSSVLITDTLIVFFPRIVALIKSENQKQLQETILQNIQLIILFSVPVSCGIFFLSDKIINVFLGKNFSPAVADLKILSIYPFIKSYSLFLSKQILISHGNEKLFLKSTVISSITFVFLALILSYYFAHVGICFAVIIVEIIGLLINYFYVKKINVQLKVFSWYYFFQALAGTLLFIPIIYIINKILVSYIYIIILSILSCFIVYIFFLAFVFRNKFLLQVKTDVGKYFLNKRTHQ
ncbi:MAG TPA: oligosaccharide flippase family protein [Puia sp.]|nr:oligosaccharide flippase family protein [Puia sp.]